MQRYITEEDIEVMFIWFIKKTPTSFGIRRRVFISLTQLRGYNNDSLGEIMPTGAIVACTLQK